MPGHDFVNVSLSPSVRDIHHAGEHVVCNVGFQPNPPMGAFKLYIVALRNTVGIRIFGVNVNYSERHQLVQGRQLPQLAMRKHEKPGAGIKDQGKLPRQFRSAQRTFQRLPVARKWIKAVLFQYSRLKLDFSARSIEAWFPVSAEKASFVFLENLRPRRWYGHAISSPLS